MTFNEIVGFNMALATGDDAGAGAGLSAWRNADAQYIAGELKPTDIVLGWEDTPPTYETKRHGPMSTTRVQQRYSVNRKSGVWKSIHAFQTTQFLFWLLQTAGTPTTEGTPASYNTHLLTIGSSSIPLFNGIHYEQESISSNETRYDIMGILPTELRISIGSGDGWGQALATQEITCQYANRIAAAEITPQTQRPPLTVGTIWKNYEHLVTGNGIGLNPSTLTYNSNPYEADIIGARFIFKRKHTFGPPDVNGLMTAGFMHGFDFSVELDIHPVGDVFYTVNKTKKESYAGDLAFAPVFVADATNDKTTFDYNKLFQVPVNLKNDYKPWFEGYTVTFEPYDYTSVFTGTGIDGLDNTHFENP